ncbi:hypothetical protein OZD61_05475 [Wolbachia endosymbiont of Drosophila bocki]|uniref:hypothetical protein n=1 Tax=unclassified Wolbachia TaxID=2640676 RepID=UPI0023A9FC9B|nr:MULTISPECIES: hypothetical protein [unclassified Wolbachia]MDE5058195.1 hypothetical protein [Wolbachia endosymbiont of Drosophila bocki]MDE5066633.1 hypothetical protein [Wolbachia endosymbiont of Drosophila leontia]
MIRVRLNLRKRLKQKFVMFTLLINALFVSYFLIRNTGNTSSQIIAKEINIGTDNEK